MKRPRVHKKRISVGPSKVSTVSKIRRANPYGTRSEWSAITAEVKKRDGYKCVKCGRGDFEYRLQVDHIVEVSRGGSNSKHNLRTLCGPCHANRPSHRHAKQLILSRSKR